MHDLARQYTEMWIIFDVFHLQPPPRPTMYSGVGWGCCSDILEAVMGPSGAKTRYFLLFPRLKHAEYCCLISDKHKQHNQPQQATAPASLNSHIHMYAHMCVCIHMACGCAPTSLHIPTGPKNCLLFLLQPPLFVVLKRVFYLGVFSFVLFFAYLASGASAV
jgi:hypothetical protein